MGRNRKVVLWSCLVLPRYLLFDTTLSPSSLANIMYLQFDTQSPNVYKEESRSKVKHQLYSIAFWYTGVDISNIFWTISNKSPTHPSHLHHSSTMSRI